MNYKRKKPRTQVKCNLCTDSRVGNKDQIGIKPSVTLNKRRAKLKEKDSE